METRPIQCFRNHSCLRWLFPLTIVLCITGANILLNFVLHCQRPHAPPLPVVPTHPSHLWPSGMMQRRTPMDQPQVSCVVSPSTLQTSPYLTTVTMNAASSINPNRCIILPPHHHVLHSHQHIPPSRQHILSSFQCIPPSRQHISSSFQCIPSACQHIPCSHHHILTFGATSSRSVPRSQFGTTSTARAHFRVCSLDSSPRP